jgi:tetratricopeptide (TPR) repeat protein
VAALPCTSHAQNRVSLDVSETLFSVVAAINVCGYDHEFQSSLPLRSQVRAELAEADKPPAAAKAASEMCNFYHDHHQNDSAHELAQYVSLALNLGVPPEFTPQRPEADLPPDAIYVLGFGPLLKEYYSAAKMHQLWLKHQAEYLALIDRYHEPVAEMISGTDNYLRIPISGYMGRTFTVYLEPMCAPGQVNSRNYYQDSFYVVISPAGNDVHIDAIRHTYLHYVLEPLIAKRATALKRLEPLLVNVKNAPMSEEYRHDTGLLVIECLIRAIEARLPADPKMPEKDRLALVKQDEEQGYILTGVFYDDLKGFEKDNRGLQDAFPDFLHDIDLADQQKMASQIQFASQAAPELMRTSKPASQPKIVLAERDLASGNPVEAEKLAQDSLEAKEDPARAFFVLARAATMLGNMQGARDNFQKALESSKDPRITAWCHIYLGRILDLQDEREAAVAQYQAALETGDASPETRSAAQRGLKQAYEPPTPKQQEP